MTIYTPTLDQREVEALADDVRQLTGWWTRSMIREWYTWSRSRNKVWHHETITVDEPPLLDQLRAAAAGGLPQHVRGPERAPKPDTRPPPGWNQDASARLASIYVELSGWHARLRMEAPLVWGGSDWQKTVLHKLVGRAPELDRRIAEELARDVRRWWRWSVRQVGLSPKELLDERRQE